MRLQIGIAGWNSSEARYRPQTYLNTEPGQDLVVRLCDGPVAEADVEPSLLEGLRGVEAIRVHEGECYLNFTCFLRDDIALLDERGAEFGSSLADAIESAITASALPSLHFARPEDIPKYLFFLVGCVVLDWRGLAILAKEGYTLDPSETKRPGGGNYTIFGNEVFERNLKEHYWGSHNSSWGSYWFTSFGDHDSERGCLPDLAWRLESMATEDPHASLCSSVRKQAIKSYTVAAARHLLGEEQADGDLQNHLEELHYTQGGDLAVPVLVAQDRDEAQRFINDLHAALAEWIAQHHDAIQQTFAKLAPARQGVQWREMLVQVWHYVFAHANRVLCRRGSLYDPYCADSSFPGYLPVVYHERCKL